MTAITHWLSTPHPYWSLVVAAIAGILWGTTQGMAMIQIWDKMADPNALFGGIRCHVWFSRVHLLFGALAASLVLWGRIVTLDPWIIGLSLLIGWCLSEPFYNYARYRKFISDVPEHINFLDIINVHAPSRVMNIIRIGIVAVLTAIMVSRRKEK